MIMKASPDPDALFLNKQKTGRQKPSSLSHQFRVNKGTYPARPLRLGNVAFPTVAYSRAIRCACSS